MSDRLFARRVVIAIALGSVFALLCYTATLLLLGFAGVLGAVLADAAAQWVRKRTGVSHRVSHLLVLFGAIAIAGIAVWLLVPRVAVQLDELNTALPKALENGRAFLNRFPWGRAITSHFGGMDFGALATKIAAASAALINIGVAVTVVVVLTGYLAGDPGYYKRGVLELLPAAWRPVSRELFSDVGSTLRRWLIGQSVPMVILGIVTMAGLLILHIPLAFTLSIFTGLMIFIPFAGAVIAYLATALVTLSADPSKLLIVTALFLAIHILEGYVITPLVQKRAVYLPPALTIIAQVLMTTLFGFLGLMLATPLAAALLTVIDKLYLEPRSQRQQ